MDFVIDFITNTLDNPTVMLGVIACIGLMFLRRNISDIVMETVKIMIEYLILSVGTAIVGIPVTLPTTLVQRGLDIDGMLPLYWVVYAESMAKFGTEAALVSIIGFITNILPARSTPWKNLTAAVYLQLFWAGFTASTMAGFGFSGITLIAIGGLIPGVYYWTVTTISTYYLELVTTEHANFVPSVIALVITGEAGRPSKKGGKSIEEVEFPSLPNWLKDSIIATRMAVFVMNFTFASIAGPAVVGELTEETPWILYTLIQSLTSRGGVVVIFYGVHMMLAELIPTFSGAAEKLLPDVVLGLDYLTVLPYTGTAVTLGFVFSPLGLILTTLVMAFIGFSPVMVPGVQIDFPKGALVGVYANARGGLKNCIFSTLITGSIFQFAVALTFPITGHLMAAEGAYEAVDFNIIGHLIVKFISLFH